MRDAGDDDLALLPDSVYGALRDEILAGEIPPGASLSVPRLAARLGVSRSPAREAVQRLIVEGLAVHVPHAGARVADVDDITVREVLSVREVLDGLAARTATTLMTADEIDALKAVVVRQEEALASPVDEARDSALDLEFHGLIRAAARNSTLDVALARIEAIAHLHGSHMWMQRDYRQRAVAEHRVICTAIAAGDPETARRAAEAHVRAIASRLE